MQFEINNRATNYMFKVNNEIFLKMSVKTPERHHCRRSGLLIVDFKQISHLVLVFLLLTLRM